MKINFENNETAKKIYIDLKERTKDEIIDICTSQTLVIFKKEKEIERLNNIIEQYEEYLISSFNTSQDTKYLDDLMKLKELKGSDKK